IGEHVVQYPEIAKKIADDGFDIGNHTFTHSYNVHDSPSRLSVELGATSRVLERVTGERTRYYRPPYLLSVGIDPAPNPWIDAIPQDSWTLALGYLPIGSDIDTHDWDAKTPDEIVQHFNEQLASDRHIVLMHDTPGTADALKIILPSLLEQGYTFASLEELFVPPEQAGTLAPLKITQPPIEPIESGYIYFLSNLGRGLVLLGGVALSFIVVRLLLIAVLLHKKNKELPPRLKKYPFVSILIPAYNEEENIESTVRSILQNSYPRREIIVIDDGSTDNTGAIVKKIIAGFPESVIRLIQLKNGGKANALTAGMRKAQGEILVILDADAVLSEGALHAFVRHFGDPRVGAVAGKVYPAVLNGFLSKFQALEYAVGQNLEKRAFSALGVVGVVPGPAGAWRKDAILKAGGFPTDTLVEDQDMTLTLMRQGWRIAYEPEAIAYTETPPNVSTFLKQRFRWVYGGIQCFWKHLDVIWEQPRSPMSTIIIPHTFIFGILLPLTYPIVDSVLIFSLIFGVWREVLVPVLLFTAVDCVYALWGLRGEPNKRQLLIMVPLLRLVYRQLLYYTVLRGLVRAIEGTGAAWNKFEKVGETQLFYETKLNGVVAKQSELIAEQPV
ncbi:glycosyltransferase, partial [Candidatus Parcubacteria bacterium]|nr:glycosyltransferase [Candidatus Parcubacteria bacterium]